MYYDDNSSSNCFFSMLILGAMNFFAYRSGKQVAYKEIEEAISRDEIKNLKSEVNKLNGRKPQRDQWNDLRRALKLPVA